MKKSLSQPLVAVIAALVAGTAVAATATSTPSAPAANAAAPLVHINNFAFGPQTLTVRAGTIVTWVNDDEEPHTVTASDHSYRSPILNTGRRVSHRYDTPGQYAYFCSLHPHMTGRIVVTA
jgi:plastocyanin